MANERKPTTLGIDLGAEDDTADVGRPMYIEKRTGATHTGAAISGGLAAAIISVGAIVGAHHYIPPAKPQIISATTQRAIRNAWPELKQVEVDKLTQGLIAIASKKRMVTIICIREPLCGGLALDLDNAFESAKWETQLDTLVFGDFVGIGASDQDLVDVLSKNTGLAVKLDKQYQEYIDQIAKATGNRPAVTSRIIIGRNAEENAK